MNNSDIKTFISMDTINVQVQANNKPTRFPTLEYHRHVQDDDYDEGDYNEQYLQCP